MFIRALSVFFCLYALFGIPVSHAEQEEQEINPPFVTNSTITGTYYFAQENLVRDISIATPINGKFYFNMFIAQSPISNQMTVQYYNEVDGVATFNKQGVGVFNSPYKNCTLYFFFQPPNLIIEQEKSCGMAAEFGLEARGTYTQLEAF